MSFLTMIVLYERKLPSTLRAWWCLSVRRLRVAEGASE